MNDRRYGSPGLHSRYVDAARLRAVFDAAVDVASELDLDAVLQKVVDAVRELIGARYAALGILHPHTSSLARFIVSGLTREEMAAIAPWPQGRGLLGFLLREPKPLRLRDVSRDERSVGFPPHHPPMASFLGAPVRLGDRIIGSFYLTEKIGGDEFSQEDEDLLVIFAAQVAVAVENARRFTETGAKLSETLRAVQRSERRSRFLVELSALLPVGPAADDLPYHLVADRVAHLLDGVCAVTVFDGANGDGARLDLVHHPQPALAAAARRLLEDGREALHSHVIARAQPLYVTDATPPAEAPAGLGPELLRRERFAALMAVPIRTERKVYGIVAALTTRPAQFSAEDLDFGVLVADRLGMAIEHATLVQELRAALKARDEFISIATHELKTPVTSIKGYAQLLRKRLGGASGSEHKALEAISRQSERLASLTNELLDVARLQAGKLELRPERTDLVALCRDATERLPLQLPERDDHRLHLLAREAELWGEWDPARVDQVLVNLISNALKYSPQGGEVVVEVRREGDEAVVSVADSGIGIPADEQARIFETFHRARNATQLRVEGAGLGLHIANEIVQRHGGRMWFNSEQGVGSTFFFALPLPREG